MTPILKIGRAAVVAAAMAAFAVPMLSSSPAEAYWVRGPGWHPGWGWHAGYGWRPYGWRPGWVYRGGVWGPPVVVVGRGPWIPGHWWYGRWIPGHWG